MTVTLQFKPAGITAPGLSRPLTLKSLRLLVQAGLFRKS